MNQKQRDALVAHVGRMYNEEKRRIEAKKPEPPSLNNFLVAAILDGSIAYKSPEEVKQAVRNRVLKLGRGNVLVKERSRRGYGDDDVDNAVTFAAEDIFYLPAEYVFELEKYNEARATYEAALQAIAELKETIELKILIGSAESLSNLIEQAENLADLNFVGAKLTASNAPHLAVNTPIRLKELPK